MKISQQGIDLIKSFEGLVLKAYRCPANILTIGYGHTGDVKEGQTVTQIEAENLLKVDLKKFEDGVKTAVKIKLSQPQFDALVSFSFNVGLSAFVSSTLLNKLNHNDIMSAANEFLRWNKANNVVLPGLTRRREAERQLFLSENISDLALIIYNRMKALGCRFRAINIVYLEDSDEFGNPLPNSINAFNDRCILLRKYDCGKVKIIHNSLATTEPGLYYRQNPMNSNGAAQIKLDTQFKNAWKFGTHGTPPTAHPALVQCDAITVMRDRNTDGSRSGDTSYTGLFGINQHGIYGYSQPQNNIGKASAGCMVRFDYADHEQFMKILKDNHQGETLFDTIVLDTTKLHS